MIEADSRECLPEIEAANAKGEKLMISFLADQISKQDLVKTLFETSHLDRVAIYFIILNSEYDLISNVCQCFEDGHDCESHDLPKGTEILHDVALVKRGSRDRSVCWL